MTGEKVTNKFTGSEAIDTTPLDATEKDGSFDPGIPWFSRKNFPSPEEFSALNAPRAATPSAKMQPYDGAAEKAQAWDAATGTDVLGNPIPTEAPVWGADNGLSLTNANGSISDLGKELGADYDNAKWEALLDQLEIGEVVGMISEYYGTDALSSVGKPVLTDLDGPAQIKGFNFALGRSIRIARHGSAATTNLQARTLFWRDKSFPGRSKDSIRGDAIALSNILRFTDTAVTASG